MNEPLRAGYTKLKSVKFHDLMAIFSSRLGSLAVISLVLLVVIALGLIAGTVYMLTNQTRGIAEAFRPRVDSKVVLSGSIERLQTEGKLVVLTADVQAEASSSTRKFLFGWVDLGETTVRVRAPAKVQYVVSLSGISREDFTFDPESRRLVIAVPLPHLDTTIVEVSTDPAEIEMDRSVGWLRLDSFSGKYDERRARRLLRDAAIHAGRSGSWLADAQESARVELHRLLLPLIDALDEDVDLIIAFYEGDRPVPEERELPSPASP